MIRASLCLFVVAACGDNLTPNRPPTAEPFTLTTPEDLPVTRVIDADDLDNDELTAEIPIPAEHGEVNLNGLSLTYMPDPNYNGPDQFAIVISDGEAELSLTIDVTVESEPDAPFAIDDALATTEDTASTVTSLQLLANDTDPDGDTLSVVSVGTAINGTVALVGDNVTFTPTANFSGTGSFKYTITDGALMDEGTVSVVIDGANDAPTAVDDVGFTTPEDTAITITQAQLIANDTDPRTRSSACPRSALRPATARSSTTATTRTRSRRPRTSSATRRSRTPSPTASRTTPGWSRSRSRRSTIHRMPSTTPSFRPARPTRFRIPRSSPTITTAAMAAR